MPTSVEENTYETWCDTCLAESRATFDESCRRWAAAHLRSHPNHVVKVLHMTVRVHTSKRERLARLATMRTCGAPSA